MNDSFKNVMFDKMLRLTHPYSLIYRDLLLFILYFVIFHSQIPLFGIWRLYIFSLNVHVSVYNHYIEKKKLFHLNKTINRTTICESPKKDLLDFGCRKSFTKWLSVIETRCNNS